MTALRSLPGDPFPFEDDLNRALADWRDPVVVWAGRAVWAAVIVAGFACGVGIVFTGAHLVRVVRR